MITAFWNTCFSIYAAGRPSSSLRKWPEIAKRRLAQNAYARSIAGSANGTLRMIGGRRLQYESRSHTTRKAGAPMYR